MAATTTPSISWVVKQLKETYPDLTFTHSDQFSWHPSERRISYENRGDFTTLLHEVGHALLNHQDYQRDIELLAMERQAWVKAGEVARSLGLSIPEDSVEEHLDSYREWLHTKSTCITCGQTGVETSKHHYTCLTCDTSWRVNDARQQHHRRYKIV